MKPSKYNICLPYNDRFVIFNGITKRFFLVSSQNKEVFLQILSTPDEFKEQYAPFLQRMAKEGFIIENSIDELEVIKQQYVDITHDSCYKLMILPTYACNVSCWYCTQNHRNMQLSDDDVERVKKHIAYYLTHNDIKRFQLAWFGGEPLLTFHRIEEIASFAKTFCQEHSISYHNTITTNGTLLSRRILEKMKDLDFTFFQITVDGTKDEHDKVKVIKGKSAYEMTLRNICLISEIIPEAEICLRYNYTTDNLKPDTFIKDLEQYLPEDIRKRINLSVMKVWQEDEKGIDNQKLDTLVTSASEDLFNVSVGQGFHPCYVDKLHFNSVFPNGRIGKCDNLDPDTAQGYITDSGEIVWEEDIPAIHYTVFDDIESECLSCQYLPICSGPCPKERDEIFLKGGHLRCRFQDAERLWQQNIIYYCRKFLHLILLIMMPYIAFAQNDSTKMAMKDSIYKNVDLKNVTITGKSVMHYPDKDVWAITDSLRQGAYSVKELIDKLPGFIYDPFTREVTYQGGSAILYLLDGKEKRENYVGELAHQRFEKIEIIRQPTGKYEGFSMVINMITKENWKGYEINLFNMEHATPTAPYGSLLTMAAPEGTYTYVKPQYDVAIHYGYVHSNSHKRYDYFERNGAYQEHSIDMNKPTSVVFSNKHDFWADFGYQLAKGHSLSFIYAYSGSHSKNYLQKTVERKYFTDGTSTTIQESSRVHDKSNDHTITAHYVGNTTNWTLESELTYEKYLLDQTNNYRENKQKLYETPYDNQKDFLYWNFDATKRFRRKATLNMGYINVYKKYNSKSNSSVSKSNEYRTTAYLSLSYNLNNQLSVRAGGNYRNIRRDHNEFGDDTQKFFSFNGRIYYHPSMNKNLEFSYARNIKHPTLKQTNTNGRWINTEIYTVGNPYLKSTTTHQFNLRAYVKPFSLNASYDYSNNTIMQVYEYRDATAVLTYENIKTSRLQTRLTAVHSFPFWGGSINMNGMIIFERIFNGYADLDKHSQTLSGVASVRYRRRNCPSVGLSYTNFAHETITLQGKSISGPDVWTLSLSHMMFDNRLSITLNYHLPIAWTNRNNLFVTHTPFYESCSSYNAYEYMKNTLNLTVMYRFAKGRQSYRKRTMQNTESE